MTAKNVRPGLPSHWLDVSYEEISIMGRLGEMIELVNGHQTFLLSIEIVNPIGQPTEWRWCLYDDWKKGQLVTMKLIAIAPDAHAGESGRTG